MTRNQKIKINCFHVVFFAKFCKFNGDFCWKKVEKGKCVENKGIQLFFVAYFKAV